jgi:hypothetical protein
MSDNQAITELQRTIEQHIASGPAVLGNPDAMRAFLALRTALEDGEVRAASPDPSSPTGWRVNTWVKQGILLGFRLGTLEELPAGGLSFVDKQYLPGSPIQHPGRGAHRPRRLIRPRRSLRGARRGLHAADVHQRRRLC